MEILILSCGTGGGHDTAGQALTDELRRRGHSVYFEDAYRLTGKKASAFVNDSYIKLVQRAPKVFGQIYSLGDAYRRLSIHSPVYWLNGKLADHVLQYIDAHHFDAIVMTHMLQQREGAAARMRDAQQVTIDRNATSDLCSFIERSHTQQQQWPGSSACPPGDGRRIGGNRCERGAVGAHAKA